MFNKFKIGDLVRVFGSGKIANQKYTGEIGRVIEKDSYFLDYLIRFKNKSEDWIDEQYLKLYRNRKRGKKWEYYH